jgi:hypothetical protein
MVRLPSVRRINHPSHYLHYHLNCYIDLLLN